MQTSAAKVVPLGPEGPFWVVVSRYRMVCKGEELDSGVSSACFQIPTSSSFLSVWGNSFPEFPVSSSVKKGTLRW